MSCYEWERGYFTLPLKDHSRVKHQVREFYGAQVRNVLSDTKQVHRLLVGQTRQIGKYAEVLRWSLLGADFGTSRVPDNNASLAVDVRRAVPDPNRRDLAVIVLEAMLSRRKNASAKTVATPTRADVPSWCAPPTNRTTTFPALAGGFPAATLTFEAGGRIAWDVDEGNRAVDRAHESPLGEHFFALMNRMDWGTRKHNGGYGIGNNEYHRDDTEVGGGGNYVTFTFGPLGESAHRGRVFGGRLIG